MAGGYDNLGKTCKNARQFGLQISDVSDLGNERIEQVEAMA